MDGCTLNDFLDAVLNIELARPLQDICSNRFFHGKLNRQTTETLLNQDGHFLVRESSTQTGEYVLSCRFKGTPMHFIIHEYPLSVEENGQRQYAFDGPKFSSVAQLIAFYVDNQQPITQVSNALICEPVQRNLPLNAKALKKCKIAKGGRSNKTDLFLFRLLEHAECFFGSIAASRPGNTFK